MASGFDVSNWIVVNFISTELVVYLIQAFRQTVEFELQECDKFYKDFFYRKMQHKGRYCIGNHSVSFAGEYVLSITSKSILPLYRWFQVFSGVFQCFSCGDFGFWFLYMDQCACELSSDGGTDIFQAPCSPLMMKRTIISLPQSATVEFLFSLGQNHKQVHRRLIIIKDGFKVLQKCLLLVSILCYRMFQVSVELPLILFNRDQERKTKDSRRGI